MGTQADRHHIQTLKYFIDTISTYDHSVISAALQTYDKFDNPH